MNQKQPLDFSLRADVITRRIFWCLLGFELLIVFLDVFVNHYEWSSVGSIRRMVNITREDSLSNWFSSLQAIIVGSVIWLTAFAARKQMQDNHYKRKFYCWAGIGSFFIYIGIDDAIKFHERVGTAFKVLLFESEERSGTGILDAAYNAFPSYTWQIVFGPFFMAMGIFILWFLLKELSSQRLKYLFIVAICMYVLTVGMDYVEGLDSETFEGIADFFSTEEYRIRHMSKTIEEFFEMFATTIFLIVFLKNLFKLSREWKINIVEKS
jgi:hypothetical protein